jgi:hypothetical protein
MRAGQHNVTFCFHPGFESPKGSAQISTITKPMDMGYVPEPDALYNFTIDLDGMSDHVLTINGMY